MELQQERIVKERKLRHDQVTELQQLVVDELGQIRDLALTGPGDRPFVRHAVAYLLGRGALTEFNLGLSGGYDWVDNARLYIITAIVFTLAPEGSLNQDRLERMVSYLRGRHYLAEDFDDAMERLTGMRAANVLALA